MHHPSLLYDLGIDEQLEVRQYLWCFWSCINKLGESIFHNHFSLSLPVCVSV